MESARNSKAETIKKERNRVDKLKSLRKKRKKRYLEEEID